jgi:hypothetical protein
VSKWHGGKGSAPRPIANRKQYEDNWDRIFAKKTVEVLDELTQLSQEMGEYDNTIRRVKINKCSGRRWYSKHVGETWPVISDEGDEYKCRASDGFLNFILKEDCEPC